MNDLTLIIPAKSERESLPRVLDELIKLQLNIIIVLEPSDLDTINAVSNYKCKIVKQINKGYGDAIKLGMDHVETDYFCIFNADGSFLPEELTKMYKIAKEDQIDFVFGSRYMKNGSSEDDTIITYLGNKFFTFLGNILFSLNISDILYTFVLGDNKSALKLNLEKKDFSFCIELPIKAKKFGYKLKDSPSYERARFAGKKKVNAFKDGFLILVSMIKLIFFTKPKVK
tara:strand:- start:1546 stop:2229 length:684 start_codon:yes stop_codon:yes gene_type:complete